MNNLMLISSTKNIKYLLRSLSILAITSLVLTSCGSGSKTPNKTNPNTNNGNGSGGSFTYKGEKQAATPDVIKFQTELWVNIAPADRCGGCHSDSSAKQSPMFARGDDINLAYEAVISNNLVSLASPSESRIVSKVSSGHHCWLKDPVACGDTITTWITKWAGEAGTTTNTVVLKAPAVKDIGNAKTFPLDSTAFEEIIHKPFLLKYCSNCHSESALTKQQPYFASGDIAVAYEAAKTKIRLDNPKEKDSRFVVRLGTDFHNCWSDCVANSKEMLEAIEKYALTLDAVKIDPALIVSKAVGLSDAFVLSSGGRVDTNLIAKYEFKSGKGTIAYDTSGISPAADLNLIGNVGWSSAWGIKIRDAGRAQASTANSRKLFDLINGSGEYTIETWIIPDNVTQGGNDNNPSRIVSYSGSDTVRNFTLGQYEYNYDFLNRTTKSDANGLSLTNGDAFHTNDTDQRVQATLQHAVVTFDPVNGRKIYVNGEDITQNAKDQDPDKPASLKDWDSNFALVVGNEVTGNATASNWSGNMRFLGIHKRAMSAADIAANYKVGVGAKYLLLFNISELLDTDATKYSGSFIVFEVQQIDDYGYLFANPFFVNLDGKMIDSDIPLQGVRIGVNGEEAPVGQVFANLTASLNSGKMDTAGETKGRQYLSNLGTVIAAKNGPDTDQFFITFDKIGSRPAYNRPVPSAPAAVEPAAVVGQPQIGLRRFAEINATLSVLTGVPTSNPAVYTVYQKVQQQLPTLANLDGFLAAQQMGITQLAVSYCNALVSDPTSRDQYFGSGFPFTAPVAAVFPADSANRDQIINPLLNRLFANGSVSSQPTAAEMKTVLNALITNMANCSGNACNNRTLTTVKATCSAAFGSAAMLLQ
ncbi:MAG: LamG domain-containing protein [Gammaproteobacteria bacterium]|nr:MAG: LamG domain-containing protein [Gammaproteobacteria bacterium]